MSLGFTVRGDDNLRKVIRDLGPRAELACIKAVTIEAEKIMTASKLLVPVDLGVLRSSGSVRVEVTNRKITAHLGYGGAAAKYAVYIHEGTGPAVGRPAFMPPPQALAAWAHRHGIPEKALFALARAIGQRGLKPRKFLERPANEAKKGMEGRLADTLRAELRKFGAFGGFGGSA